MNSKIRVFEAFAGIGTQRMALRNVGVAHTVVAISEVDKFAVGSYMAIHGDTLNLGDISQVETSDIPEHDLFTYSFPCQDISNAGEGKGLAKDSGTRSSLLWECEKVIETKRPKYLLMENVKALINKKHKPHFEEWLNVLYKYGYTSYTMVLDAYDFGGAQRRERVFVVSILGEHIPYQIPVAKPNNMCVLDILEEEPDPKNIITGEDFKRIIWDDVTRTGYLPYKTAKTPKQHQSNTVYDSLKPLPTLMYGDYKSPKKVYIDEPTPHLRKLSPLEYWRLMGISDSDFYKAQAVNSNTQLYKQAGNAISVYVLEAIFHNLFKGGH